MDKVYYINQLTKNPKYDEEWVKFAAEILESEEFTLDEIKDLYVGQIIVLNEAIKKKNDKTNPLNINLHKLVRSNLNATQMRIYIAGLENNVSEERMEFFLNPEIPYSIMNYAVNAMVNGKESILKYISQGYDAEQIGEIYAGMIEGVDISIYDNINTSAEIMGLCRHVLNLNLPVEIDNGHLNIKISD